MTTHNEIYTVNWYPKKSPEIGDTVVVRKVSLDDMGVWVELLEFGCKKGFIPLAYATRSNKGEPKTIKIGKIVLATVSQVDRDKKNIDLTRHSLREEDIEKAEKRFRNYKNLMKLLLYISKEAKHIHFQDIVEKVNYPLHEKYENAYTALKQSYYQPEILDELDIPNTIRNALAEQIQRMFIKSEVRIHSLFEAEIFKTEGVELLRDALVAGYEVEKEINLENQKHKTKISISIIGPPIYSISMDIYHAQKGLEYVNKALSLIEEKIIKAQGRFEIREKPKVFKKSDLPKYQGKTDESTGDSDELTEEYN